MIKGKAEFPEFTNETLKLWNPKIVGPPCRVQWDLKFKKIQKCCKLSRIPIYSIKFCSRFDQLILNSLGYFWPKASKNNTPTSLIPFRCILSKSNIICQKGISSMCPCIRSKIFFISTLSDQISIYGNSTIKFDRFLPVLILIAPCPI